MSTEQEPIHPNRYEHAPDERSIYQRYSDALADLAAANARAEAAERERDEAHRETRATLATASHDITELRAELTAARAEIERLKAGCPFDRFGCQLAPEDACPVCGQTEADAVKEDRCLTSPARTRVAQARPLPSEEEIARVLAYEEWPFAAEDERVRWRDAHSAEEKYTRKARAMLALLNTQGGKPAPAPVREIGGEG